jgi:valyl-tRNA synthetase
MTATLIDPALEEQFELLMATIRTIRNLRAEAEVKPGVKVKIILQSESQREREILEAGRPYIQDLGKVEDLTLTANLDWECGQAFAGVVGTVQVLMPLTGITDLAALRAKLEKQLSKLDGEIQSLSRRLENPGFISKAPVEVVEGARGTLAEAQKQAEILRDRLEGLQ